MLAPNNKAFRRIVFGTLEGGDIIRQHIFRGLQFKDVLANLTEITSVSGVTHSIEACEPINQTVLVGGAYIYEDDILARSGVLHFIDRVIGFEYPTISTTSSPPPTITAPNICTNPEGQWTCLNHISPSNNSTSKSRQYCTFLNRG